MHQGPLSRLVNNTKVGPIYLRLKSVFCCNGDVENGLPFHYNLGKFASSTVNSLTMISAAETQCDHSSWKIERTAIQSLNWAAFLITRRRRGDRYTGGANVRLRLPYKYLRNFKTSKMKKCLVARFDLKLYWLPHVRSPPPWGRRRHGVCHDLPHLMYIRELHDMQGLRFRTQRRWATSSIVFMGWRSRYPTSGSRLHSQRDQGTSTVNDEHLKIGIPGFQLEELASFE